MRKLLSVAVAFASLCLAPFAAAQDVEYMKLSELKQLLAKGPVPATFKTVAEGSVPSTYDITIKGIANEANLTMVAFTTRHFIVAGMSGSPVYVTGLDGRRKLLGALAYFMSPFAAGLQWGGISPFEHMHAEATGAVAGPAPVAGGAVSYAGRTFRPIPLGRDMSFPAANGLGISTAARGAATTPNRRLRAGMPIMVDLIEWDDQTGASSVLAATGTITYVGKHGEIYAFGHPFMGARAARYNFRTCSIMGTVLSHYSSYKLAGDHSEVLGTIEYDGGYGIYGKIGRSADRSATEIKMAFSNDGRPASSYLVRLTTSPLTSLVMEYAFTMVGEAAGAPFSRQPSTAAFAATIELEGRRAIEFSQLYTSSQFPFGPRIIYNSSYENAVGDFLVRLYNPLSSGRLGSKITGMSLRFDFSKGITPSLRVASLKFPTQIRWGQNPVLELLLVSEDNTVTLSKRTVIVLDWDKIEKPVYALDTADTDKQAEKVVSGNLNIYTAEAYDMFLSDGERELESPLYFLNTDDYLTNLGRKLGRSNRMLYARVAVRKRTGLNQAVEPAAGGPAALSGGEMAEWIISSRGLSERAATVQNEQTVRFSADLPPVPSGYMVARVMRTLKFEVVN